MIQTRARALTPDGKRPVIMLGQCDGDLATVTPDPAIVAAFRRVWLLDLTTGQTRVVKDNLTPAKLAAEALR
jgi:hypothetical protein